MDLQIAQLKVNLHWLEGEEIYPPPKKESSPLKIKAFPKERYKVSLPITILKGELLILGSVLIR